MGSITIDQWRGRIGSFAGSLRASQSNNSTKTKFFAFSKPVKLLIIFSSFLVYAVITRSLLLKAGVERNPGPSTGK